VSGLQAGQQALLDYLYRHRGQTCDRRDVYRAYLEGTGRELPAKEFAKDYASALDNAIYRLRQAIEPDPTHPVLVVTVKGEGFRLDNAW
jgi:DNA-binding response OmpR family regulator